MTRLHSSLASIALLLLTSTFAAAQEGQQPPYEDTSAVTPTPVAVSILLSSGSMALAFFRFLLSILWSGIVLAFSPFVWTISLLWETLIAKPFDLFLHIVRVLYPVAMFSLAAVGCGLVIGGMAGFAAEAFSSICITATWGADAEKKSRLAAQARPADHLLEQSEPVYVDDEYEEEEEYGDEYMSEKPSWQAALGSSSKGKEPLRRGWTDSPAESSRRTSVSSGLVPDRQDEWDWADEDDEDTFPRLRRTMR
ncbi:hypothetical protein BCR43DRAFT_490822 [Syncephalastrum racemosum]|uniref:Uncharacterized protein n=1 Tax=Syncephalastrum racemosum TaxID=13706 RepID=A0A1X2HGJ6_SYNRA|nr:hypothetical protein BCR43DRAFT_490822 [Syncephalastrum racemosum]